MMDDRNDDDCYLLLEVPNAVSFRMKLMMRTFICVDVFYSTVCWFELSIIHMNISWTPTLSSGISRLGSREERNYAMCSRHDYT